MGTFKRSLFGYRRGAVDAALTGLAEKQAESERELLFLSEMVVGREREVDTLRQLLQDAHARHDRSLRSLEALAGHLDELHAQARGQATRIRMKALGDAVRVTERATEAMGAIGDLERAAGNGTTAADGTAIPDPVVAASERAAAALDQVEAAEQAAAAGRAAGANGNGAAPDEQTAADQSSGDSDRDVSFDIPDGPGTPRIVSAPGMPEGEVLQPAAVDADGEELVSRPLGYYQGEVEVEIGPLGDFAQLLGFESAAGGIDGAEEISVRRFAGGRATLGLRLDEPVELLRELEERAPFEFKVRQTGGRRLVLDIDEDAGTARPS